LRFEAQTKHVRLPAVRLWDAGLHVVAHRSGRPTYGTSWSPLPAVDGSGAGYGVELLDPASGAQLWTQPASGTRSRIDARIIEDHATDAAVVARASLHGTGAVYLSARRPVQAIAGAPPSRNRPCAAVTGTKRLTTFLQNPCAATDGDFSSPARLAARNHRTVTGVVIDLGTARRLSLIVARGLSGSVVVEESANGRTYRRVATASTSTIAVHPPGRAVARYVRVRSAGGLDESLLAEVSAW
jgi:hypothetical protein